MTQGPLENGLRKDLFLQNPRNRFGPDILAFSAAIITLFHMKQTMSVLLFRMIIWPLLNDHPYPQPPP